MEDIPIEIVEYDPRWPQVFVGLRIVISEALGRLALAIEHVGSTAVHDVPSKPILDIDVVIDSAATLPRVVPVLIALGYYHQGNLGIEGREAFGRRSADVPRDGTGWWRPKHHLYVCAQGNLELRRHLAFRDFLRDHPVEAAAYGALKRQMAVRFHNDRDGYTAAKTEFIENILRQAGVG